MPSTTNYKQGDVVLVPFPFTDLSGAKRRPAVVLSSDALNATRPDVIVAAITSQVPSALAADEFGIPFDDLAHAGLPKPSVIKLGKVVTLHQQLIIRRIGSLPAPTLALILKRTYQLF